MTEFDYDKLKDLITAANAAANEGREKNTKRGGILDVLLSTVAGCVVGGGGVFFAVSAFWVRANDMLDKDFPRMEQSVELVKKEARSLEKRVTRLEWKVNPQLVNSDD